MKQSVGALLINQEQKILLQHRDSKAPKYPNCWCFFGGAVELNETAEQALTRELEEELNIKINNFKIYEKVIIFGKEAFFFLAFFSEPLEKLKSQQTEGDDLGFFTFNESKKLEIADFCIPILEKLHKKGYLKS